MLSPPTGAGC